MVPEVPAVPAVRKVLEVLAVLVALAAVPNAQTTATARATAEAAMMKADRDFDQAAVDKNVERFLSLVAENAAFDSAEGRGREAVRKAWAPFFEPNGPRLRWRPTRAEALVAGDVGYTIGTWERHAKDARGNDVVRRGQYLTVWRKQKDGAWRAEFDTGSTTP
jgi:ketosteroid isomerase-like protein